MDVQRIASQAAGICRARPPRLIEIERLDARPCPCLAVASVGRVHFWGPTKRACCEWQPSEASGIGKV
jgi:hypothetical protein